MTDEKPSRNEDDYFKKLDQELLKAQRAQQEREAADSSRASFFMRCPKDGSQLTERDMNGVKVDVCTSCSGIWLDAGELEALRGGGQSGMSQFFSNLFGR
jgi:uncharacterized protein